MHMDQEGAENSAHNASNPVGVNPFVANKPENGGWSIPVTAALTTSTGGGDKMEIFDNENNVKVYQGLLLVSLQLGNAGRSVLLYLIHQLGYNREKGKRDYLELRANKYEEKTGTTRYTFNRGIQELINVGIIADRRTVRRGTYWINPSYLYKYNRIADFPNNYIKPEKYVDWHEMRNKFKTPEQS